MSKLEFKYIKAASCVFLTLPIPEGIWEEGGEELLHFVGSHTWLPFDGYDPEELLEEIVNHAEGIARIINA